MPAEILVALAASTAAAAPAVLQASESNSTRKATKSAMEEQQKQQDAYLASLEEEASNEKRSAESIAARDRAKAIQRQKVAAAQGRRSTILTSPLGVTGSGSTARKTILGS
ncbi:MAG: hypothetical protein A4E53_01657 [Pelotomaculum sp. PtaB.Bin104]|jgi:leucyl aminopeptidase (aminopeptidase T)|nr:MAG: hypothetical protein A4E53_01657 [Pelotomaculum sp. PtaB.Bin104]